MLKVNSFAQLRVACGLPPELPPRVKPQPIAKLPELAHAARTQNLATEESKLNGMEAQWRDILRSRERQGLIFKVRVQQYKLRLAYRTFYTPDFSFLDASGRLIFHETKGFMRDDAAVKIKAAAREYLEHDFWLVRRVGSKWEEILVKK